jgi:hypothetical protein
MPIFSIASREIPVSSGGLDHPPVSQNRWVLWPIFRTQARETITTDEIDFLGPKNFICEKCYKEEENFKCLQQLFQIANLNPSSAAIWKI